MTLWTSNMKYTLEYGRIEKDELKGNQYFRIVHHVSSTDQISKLPFLMIISDNSETTLYSSSYFSDIYEALHSPVEYLSNERAAC